MKANSSVHPYNELQSALTEKIPESLPYQTTVHERSVKMAASEFGLKYLCADNFIDLEQCLDELNNVEKDFQPRFKEFYGSEELRTCDNCGTKMEVDERFI